MSLARKCRSLAGLCFLGAVVLAAAGCRTPKLPQLPCGGELPREKTQVSLPPYVIEPPDAILIAVDRLVPKPPYRIQPLDILGVGGPAEGGGVAGVLPDKPIRGPYTVDTDGTLFLGEAYGKVSVVGLTLEDAEKAIVRFLAKNFGNPRVTLNVLQSRGLQPVAGDHLVRMDGTVSLGIYGDVYVAGLTLAQAKAAVEERLKDKLLDPEVVVDVSGYNSKVYYVVANGNGNGDQVTRFPITGNETVLDVIAQIGGVPATNNRCRIWVARPAPAGCDVDQVLPVDWNAICKCGNTTTNYQILPGDRIFIANQPLTLASNLLSRLFDPIERTYGFILFTQAFVQSLAGVGGGFFGGGLGVSPLTGQGIIGTPPPISP